MDVQFVLLLGKYFVCCSYMQICKHVGAVTHIPAVLLTLLKWLTGGSKLVKRITLTNAGTVFKKNMFCCHDLNLNVWVCKRPIQDTFGLMGLMRYQNSSASLSLSCRRFMLAGDEKWLQERGSGEALLHNDNVWTTASSTCRASATAL